ncbi:hypothetical protein D0962_33975 [Leptolyngbyaceae cyanobacterium CCMR0082]|uniref:Uncharacterized protein n=1 Tax=Adonisia turfae CCMR0082 TaxID=2304604 RepID=A0A6M0SI71_9CYAN|nr:hypothetical protein [Adonisia turfae]NEZ67713.1 hypothetical protein [Adonisia turfae CCMR0082]
MPEKLEIIAKPCSGGTCPTIYKDEQGRFFLQGNLLQTTDRQDVAVGDDEAVVEIDTSLLDALRTL